MNSPIGAGCPSCLATNGIGLCARWHLELPHFEIALNMNRSRKLDLTTTPPLAQNPCCVSVGIIKNKCSFENGTEIFKNKKSEGNYMTLVAFKIPRTAKTAKTPYNNFLSGEVFLSWLKVLFAFDEDCIHSRNARSFSGSSITCGRGSIGSCVYHDGNPTFSAQLIALGLGVYGANDIILKFKFTCKYTKNLLVRWLFVFKNFFHRTLLEAVTPIAHNEQGLPKYGN